MLKEHTESLKQSSYVLIFLFFLFPPFGLAYYLMYGTQKRQTRIAVLVSMLVLLFISSDVLNDLYIKYHNKMWYKISKRMGDSFRYQESLEHFSKLKHSDDLDVLLHTMSRFSKEMDLASLDHQGVSFDEILNLSEGFFQKRLIESVDVTKASTTILTSFLLDLELTPVATNLKDKDRKILEYFSLYLNLLESSLLLSKSKIQSDRVLSQVLAIRSSLPYEYSQFRLQNLLIFYFLKHRYSDIESHPKLATDLNDYVGQGHYNLFAYYSRGQYYLLKEDYQRALNDFLHVFKYQTRYYDIFDKIGVCLNALNLNEDIEIVSQYRLSEDLRFSQANVADSLEVSSGLLKSPSVVYSMLKVENLHNRGHILKNIVKDYDLAREHFTNIVELDEKERKEEAYYNLIMIELHTKRFKDCEQYIASLNEEFPMTTYRVKTNFIRLYLSIMQSVKTSK